MEDDELRPRLIVTVLHRCYLVRPPRLMLTPSAKDKQAGEMCNCECYRSSVFHEGEGKVVGSAPRVVPWSGFPGRNLRGLDVQTFLKDRAWYRIESDYH